MRRPCALALLLGYSLLLGCSRSDKPEVTSDQGIIDRGALDGTGLQQDSRSDTVLSDQSKLPAAWAAVASMAEKRRRHTATLLQDGTVLVVGGLGYDDEKASPTVLDTAERYNPKTNTWTSAGKMAGGAHWGHQAVLLKDGRVLVIGGCGSAWKSADCMVGVGVEIFDPKNTATPWKKARPMLSSRFEHRATVLQDGRVLVAGGFENTTHYKSVEIYDPSNDSWSSPPVTMSTVRDELVLLTMKSGRVLLAGGYNSETYQYPTTLELFDPTARTLTLLGATLGQVRYAATGTLLADGRVLLVGGYCYSNEHQDCTVENAELYNPSLDRAVAAGTPGGPTTMHTATLLADGRVLVTGGESRPTAAALFDPKANAWTQTAALNTGRQSHAAALLSDGRVLVTGGEDEDYKPFSSAEIYTP